MWRIGGLSKYSLSGWVGFPFWGTYTSSMHLLTKLPWTLQVYCKHARYVAIVEKTCVKPERSCHSPRLEQTWALAKLSRTQSRLLFPFFYSLVSPI